MNNDTYRTFNLFRWHRHIQLDIRTRRGYLCLGYVWRHAHRPVAYWSPDATPMHRKACGYFPFHAAW